MKSWDLRLLVISIVLLAISGLVYSCSCEVDDDDDDDDPPKEYNYDYCGSCILDFCNVYFDASDGDFKTMGECVLHYFTKCNGDLYQYTQCMGQCRSDHGLPEHIKLDYIECEHKCLGEFCWGDKSQRPDYPYDRSYDDEQLTAYCEMTIDRQCDWWYESTQVCKETLLAVCSAGDRYSYSLCLSNCVPESCHALEYCDAECVLENCKF